MAICMNITITGRKCTPRESFKDHAQRKLSKVERLFGSDTQAKITVTVEKHEQIVEITVLKNGMTFRAQECAVNMNEALDLCVDSIVRQIRKNKTRIEKRIHNAQFSAFAGDEPVAEETEFEIIRTKTLQLKPESVEEAILQMNMLDHQFYLFINSETQAVNLVYKRRDGGYGVLETESK